VSTALSVECGLRARSPGCLQEGEFGGPVAWEMCRGHRGEHEAPSSSTVLSKHQAEPTELLGIVYVTGGAEVWSHPCGHKNIVTRLPNLRHFPMSVCRLIHKLDVLGKFKPFYSGSCKETQPPL
jgi:hypothetical protein